MIFIRASTLRTLIETSQSGTAEASGDAQTYTDLATAQQIAAVVPATDIGTSRDAFKEALNAGTTLARIAVEVWATHFGTAPMDGWPDRHTPDFRCIPGAMSRFRPGVADSVITAAEAAGSFGLPGILAAETSGKGKDVMVRFFTVDPDCGAITADTGWIWPETMILENTTGAWAVWEILYRIRHQVAKAAKDRGCLR